MPKTLLGPNHNLTSMKSFDPKKHRSLDKNFYIQKAAFIKGAKGGMKW